MKKLIIPLFLIILLTPGFAETTDEDIDGDGLSNLEERGIGTDPKKIDTDGDGFTDGAEVELNTDPLNAQSHFESLMVSGFATREFPTGSYLIAILGITVVAETLVLFYFKREKYNRY